MGQRPNIQLTIESYNILLKIKESGMAYNLTKLSQITASGVKSSLPFY